VVGEAVEQGTGQAFVTSKDLRPFCERKIGGYDQAGLFIALTEEAKQMLSATAIQRDVRWCIGFLSVYLNLRGRRVISMPPLRPPFL